MSKNKSKKSEKTKKTKRRRLVLVLISFLFSVFLVELGTRIFFAVEVHPRLLLYGMQGGDVMNRAIKSDGIIARRWDRIVATEDKVKASRETEVGSYSKYHPHQAMTMNDFGKKLPVRINNHGYRGEDFTESHPDNVIRVINLGASSTFGYHDKDDETYPVYLQTYLNERLAEQDPGSQRSVQVLNLGIPHLNSAHIYAQFMAEVLDLDPDVVTFYEGVNDTRLIKRSFFQRFLLDLADYSLFLRFVQHTIADRLESFSATDVEAHAAGKAEGFVENVSRIADVCKQRGIHFIAISQQAKSRMFSEENIDEASYEQEVDLFREQLVNGKRVYLDGLQLLIHAEINEHLRKWAKSNKVPFVDMVRRMDEAKKRHTLATWVHLYPEGNRFLAAGLAKEIMAQLNSPK